MYIYKSSQNVLFNGNINNKNKKPIKINIVYK